MKASALYLLTAVVTGLHAFYLGSDIIWGAPLKLLVCVSFIGSAVLLVAAGVTPSRARLGAKAAIAGCVGTFFLYGPLIALSVLMPFTTGQEIRSWLRYKEAIPLAGILTGPVLVAATAAYAVTVLKLPAKAG